AGAGGAFVGPRKNGAAPFVQRNAEVLGVPLCQRLRIFGAEENAADACDSCHEILQWLVGGKCFINTVAEQSRDRRDRRRREGRNWGETERSRFLRKPSARHEARTMQ